MSDKSLFYRGFEGNTEIEDFFERFQEYAEANETGNSVYILKRPLGDKKYTYDYDKAVVILVPKHKMLFLDYGGNEEAFEEYVDDFVDGTHFGQIRLYAGLRTNFEVEKRFYRDKNIFRY